MFDLSKREQDTVIKFFEVQTARDATQTLLNLRALYEKLVIDEDTYDALRKHYTNLL
jgi:hypothetical protein